MNEIKYIKKAFDHLNITAYQVSKDTSLSEVGVNKILNGTSTNPRKSTIDILHNLLCNDYNVRKEWLLTGDGEMLLPKEDVSPGNVDGSDLRKLVESLSHKVNVLELQNKHLNREVEHLKEIDELRSESMSRYKMDVMDLKDLINDIKSVKRLG